MPIRCQNGMCRYWDEEEPDRCGKPLKGLIAECPDGEIVNTEDRKPLTWRDEVKAAWECECGRKKKAGFFFCYGCWMELPSELKGVLMKAHHGDFDEAYDRACKMLTKLGR